MRLGHEKYELLGLGTAYIQMSQTFLMLVGLALKCSLKPFLEGWHLLLCYVRVWKHFVYFWMGVSVIVVDIFGFSTVEVSLITPWRNMRSFNRFLGLKSLWSLRCFQSSKSFRREGYQLSSYIKPINYKNKELRRLKLYAHLEKYL